MLPSLPPFGSSISSFLQWENDAIQALGDSHKHTSIWACWQSAEGLCITAKEKRFTDYQLAKANFQQRGLEVAVRRSGGTSVPHGQGILAITHIAKASGSKNIGRAYLDFCAKIQTVLASLGFDTHVGPAPGAYCDGDYNILLNGLKLAGTSQRWTRAGVDKTEIILNHAVMLLTCDNTQATQRVNHFHQLAEKRAPFDSAASTSLWNAKQHIDVANKQQFFNDVVNAFQSYRPN